MAKTTDVAAAAARKPSQADLERVEAFTREPVLLEGETFDDLQPGSARRLAFEAALAEIEEGREYPSTEWRRNFSLVLGLERLLAEEPPTLRDGTTLNDHQVDALSGTLAALIAVAAAPFYALYLPLLWAPDSVALGDPQIAEFAAIVAVLVWIKHHGNIRRLLAGTEPKIGQKKKEESA